MPVLGVFFQLRAQKAQDDLHLTHVRARGIGQASVAGEAVLGLVAAVDQQRRIAAVIDDQVRPASGKLRASVNPQ